MIYFGAAIVALSTTVTLDEAAAFAAFSAKIMGPYSIEPSDSKNKASHERIQAQIMYLAKTCAKEAPSVALKLVMAAKATPLDASWPHLKELTTSILDTNEGHLLAEALFQALDGASSASPDTQKAMVEWMTSNILKGTQSLKWPGHL